MVAALRVVDRAILGHAQLDMLGVLREQRPDIVCVGYDQNDIKSAVTKLVEEEHLPVRVVQVGKFGPKGLNSSTKLKNRVARMWRTSA